MTYTTVIFEANMDGSLQAIGEHLPRCPDLLPQILTTLFEIVLFEECANQWSMSRPMLSLILLNEQIYSKLQSQIIASQPVTLSLCLSIHVNSYDTEEYMLPNPAM